jgi:hypothetical protein
MKALHPTLILLVTLVLTACAAMPGSTVRLPRIALRGGGELRVFQISYGIEHKVKNPRALRMDRESVEDVRSCGYGTRAPAVAIWWGTVDPKKGEYMLGPSGPAILLLPGGRKQVLEYPYAVGEVRLLLIYQPPRGQRILRVRIPVVAAVRGAKYEWVELAIDNPAYTP